MLEPQRLLALVYADAEPRVVHHAEDGPVHVAGLAHHALVHGADEDAVGVLELEDRDVVVPEAPAEARVAVLHIQAAAEEVDVLLAVSVFGVVDVREAPCCCDPSQ